MNLNGNTMPCHPSLNKSDKGFVFIMFGNILQQNLRDQKWSLFLVFFNAFQVAKHVKRRVVKNK